MLDVLFVITVPWAEEYVVKPYCEVVKRISRTSDGHGLGK